MASRWPHPPGGGSPLSAPVPSGPQGPVVQGVPPRWPPAPPPPGEEPWGGSRTLSKALFSSSSSSSWEENTVLPESRVLSTDDSRWLQNRPLLS